MPTIPPHWPPSVRYLQRNHYHASISNHVAQFLRADTASSHPSSPVLATATSRPSVVIRRIDGPETHPALGQSGLFAAKKLSKGQLVCHYFGEVHSDDRPSSNYDLCLFRFPNGDSIGIDATIMGNEGRFVNDFRGIRPKPNAVFVDGRVGGAGELRMSIVANEVIKKGEEIVVSYGKSFWGARKDE